MFRTLRTSILLLVICLFSSGFARQTVHLNQKSVFLNEVLIFSFQSSTRAKQFSQALQGTSTASFRPVRKRRNWSVYAGNRALITFTTADAASYKTTPQSITSTIASRLNSAARTGALELDTTEQKIAVGRSLSLQILGSEAAAAEISVGDPQLLKFQRVRGKLTYTGLAYGDTEIIVDTGNVIRTIPIKIRPYAANFPQSISSQVTGMPATATTVRGAIQSAVESKLRSEPGVAFQYALPESGPLTENQLKSFQIKVKAFSDETITAEGMVTVHIKNENIGEVRESQLWYCNDPENVRQPQTLFRAELESNDSTRMLYHHINETSSPLVFRTRVINTSDQPVRFMVIPGDSSPEKNPVLAGLQAGEQYIRGWLVNSGEVLTIPARSTLPISIRRFETGETVSGLCNLTHLSGPPVEVRSDVITPFGADQRWSLAMNSSTPWRFVGSLPNATIPEPDHELSKQVYPLPFRRENVLYTVGKEHGFIRIGQRPIARKDGQSILSGNFGVTYEIDARIENTTTANADVEVVFEASAGYTGAVFVIDGKVYRLPLLQPREEIRLLRYKLIPGAWDQFNMITFPLSGSSYPATLKIRPVDPMMSKGLRLAESLKSDSAKR